MRAEHNPHITTLPPYRELFILDTGDGPAGSDTCGYVCNACFRPVDDGPCPDHAPLNVPGLRLVDCNASPRHPHVWVVDSDAEYAHCMFCAITDLMDAHAGCEHAQHGRWRRWRLTHRLASHAYSLGVIAASGTTYDAHCHGCLSHIYWHGRRPYVLGWPRWKWNCLLREHHWPGVFVGLDSCAKCMPCPDCGSSTSCFDGWCERTTGAAGVSP